MYSSNRNSKRSYQFSITERKAVRIIGRNEKPDSGAEGCEIVMNMWYIHFKSVTGIE